MSTRSFHDEPQGAEPAREITAPPPPDETPVIDEQTWAEWAVEECYADELVRMCNVVAELRHALAEALTCTAIWCMCEAHELLRSTEHDEGPGVLL